VRPRRVHLSITRGRRPEILQMALSGEEVAGGEGSLANHLIRIARGDRSFMALPVFVQRAFVARYLYARKGERRELLAPLRRARLRLGMYSWSATATVWLRHFLRWLGIDFDNVDWVIGPVDRQRNTSLSAGMTFPSGSAITASADLTSLLLSGQIDLMFSAETPAAYSGRRAKISRFLADPRAVERRYYAATGIFPPQHVLILNRSVWNGSAAMRAEIERQLKSAERLFLENQAHNPFATPWEAFEREETAALMGNCWEHGVRKNRSALRAFIDSAREVGVIDRDVKVKDLFA
jgi:4,5-dihydroxyphthalate decarboxylase